MLHSRKTGVNLLLTKPLKPNNDYKLFMDIKRTLLSSINELLCFKDEI